MKFTYLAIHFIVLLLITGSANTQTINIGDKFFDFTLPYATHDTIIHQGITLSEIIQKKPVVLAFYPADWSSGCIKQLCAFRDNFAMLEKLDAEILAISGDYVWSHHFWAKHQNYPFKLLSDHDHSVAKKYESYNQERGYNKRTVFVIDKKGIIIYIDWKYGVADDESFNNLKNSLTKLADKK
ncbi:MAG: redoxin domain-containing protein [Bacteroidota bacterium]|nr:redoxin domain-containing protein [Bacteroidota bacterium]